MYAAVAQLAVVQVGLLGALAGQLGDAGHGLALLLALLYLLHHHLGGVGVLVQVVVHLLLDEVAHIFINRGGHGVVGVDRRGGRRHGQRAQLDLRLALEHGLLYVQRYGGHDAGAYVAVLEVLLEELLDGLGYVLLEGTLVGAALRGVLSVDEAVVLLAVLVGMGEGYLYVLALQVYDGVEGIAGHAVLQQVLQSAARQYAPVVVHDGQPRVQVGVVAQHGLHNLVVELVVLEQRVVRFKEYVRPVLVLCGLCDVADQLSALEGCPAHLSVAIAVHLEVCAQRVDGLHAHAVQAYGLLEGLRVVLAAGVEHAHGVDHLALRDAAAVVAHADAQVVADGHLNAVAGVHLELVDAVVDDLLQQHVDAVLGQRAVAQPADVHAGAEAYVLRAAQRAYVVVVIVYRFRACR